MPMFFKRTLIIISSFIFTCYGLYAQELNAKVSFNTQKIATADAKIFKTLEQQLSDFLNGRKWTEDDFKPNEKIDCSFFFTITGQSTSDPNKYSATLIIQSSRPVFGTDYVSNSFNWEDNISFSYKENDPLEFNENVYINNLTAVLGFYADVILGLHYDSFSKGAGSTFFNNAETVANYADPNEDNGWKQGLGDNTRMNLIKEIQNARFLKFQDLIYNYYINGFDLLSEDISKGKVGVLSALNILKTLNEENPNSLSLRGFVDAHDDEIISLFNTQSKAEKEAVLQALSGVNAVRSEQYRQRLNNN